MINKKTEICGIFNYATMLKETDLTEQTVDTLSDAQAKLIHDNLYIKSEVDMKFQEMLAKFDQSQAESNARFVESLAKSDIRFEQTLAKLDQSIAKSDARQAQLLAKFESKFELLRAEDNARFQKSIHEVEKSIHDAMYKTIGVLGSIVILTGAVASLWHHFV